MFGFIDPANTRRFAGPDGDVLAIFDHCRSCTTYSQVGTLDGRAAFVSVPRPYWSDEISEIDSGGRF